MEADRVRDRIRQEGSQLAKTANGLEGDDTPRRTGSSARQHVQSGSDTQSPFSETGVFPDQAELEAGDDAHSDWGTDPDASASEVDDDMAASLRGLNHGEEDVGNGEEDEELVKELTEIWTQ